MTEGSARRPSVGLFATCIVDLMRPSVGFAAARLIEYGPNVLAKDQRSGIGKLLWRAAINPLVILLVVLATISFATGDARAGIVISLMITLGVGLWRPVRTLGHAARRRVIRHRDARADADGAAGDRAARRRHGAHCR